MRGIFFVVVVALTVVMAAIGVAAAPPTRPVSVPALIVGSLPPQSFVVGGIVRFSKSAGLAFRVATDSRRQLCVLYDSADGTPLFLSDGGQTLVYDLANARVVRLPNSRANVRVNWDAAEQLPLRFNFGVAYQTNPEKLSEDNAWFRIDQFVDASGAALKRLAASKNTELFAAERQSGSIESLQRSARNASWFRFTSLNKDQNFYRLELEATSIGQRPPESALAFPDVKRLGQDVAITDLDQQVLPAFLVFLRDGRVWIVKLALSAGPEMHELGEKAMPGANWDELRRRDAEFGEQYRAALARQGIRFPLYKAIADTQPSH